MRVELWMAGMTALVGCGSGDGGRAGEVTWHGEIAPLLADRCGSCHQEGGIAPFSVASYDEAAAWAPAMLDAVQQGRMPPFAAVVSEECRPEVWFQDDDRLTDDEQALLDAWVADGAPEGEGGDGAAPMPESLDLADPNVVLSLPQPFTVEPQAGDIYQCFRIEVPTDQDVWITGLQVLPDNDAVVHHVLVWKDPLDQSAGLVGPDGSYRCSGEPDVWPTEMIAGWTPGGSPMRAPEGTGALLKAGATIVVNVHYHPTTRTEVDQTSIALEWTTEQPDNYITWYMVDIPFGAEVQPGPDDPSGEPEFFIPAGVPDHVETVLLDTGSYIPWTLPIFAITPHMHYLGTEMLVTIRRDDADECLIHTPNYRFDFQTSYVYDAELDDVPQLLPGDKVEVRCTYDNSMANPYIDQALAATGETAPYDVVWGENTGDEMCMAMVGLVMPPIDLSEYF